MATFLIVLHHASKFVIFFKKGTTMQPDDAPSRTNSVTLDFPHSRDVTSTEEVYKSSWKLKLFGRFVAGSKKAEGNQWKMSKPSREDAGDLVLTIVDSGHMLVSLGQELLDGFSLLDAPSFLKAQQHSDTLFLRLTVKRESRLVRMQFDGSSKTEALKQCGSAVLRLKEYLPVTTKRGLPPAQPPPSQSPTQTTTQDLQVTAGEPVNPGPEVVQGSLSITRLTQHFLGEHALSLPLMYRQCTLSHGELEPFLRLCLLDPSFPAWVEEVEAELARVRTEGLQD
ncbi:hypothetical protein DPEC_G00346020 [Dallia pectoralis]|uniref:Uncharacterized protein n=1 Tax=Dallia pectoralis TaxID=75939 RepID=A0ACC2F3U1_DALPE|nr:hypothetical protein DPEC_G00346020 [Dallia pectoralis]